MELICGSYQDFRDRGLLLTRKVLNQGFLLVNLKSSLQSICVTNDHGYVPLVVSTTFSFPHSWLITWFLTGATRWVLLVEQELLTLLEHLSSPPVFSGVPVARSSVFCRLLSFLFLLTTVLSFHFLLATVLSVLFLLAIVLSVHRFMDSEYPFGIFKLFKIEIWLSTSTRGEFSYHTFNF